MTRKDVVDGSERSERGTGKEMIHCQVFTMTVKIRRAGEDAVCK